MTNIEIVYQDLENVRKQRPLVHNITNYVVMNNTANALLAIGASPVMAHALEEVEDMVKIASSLVINIGTLSNYWIESMLSAMKAAKEKDIPIVFDPVGVGATPYRNQISEKLLTTVSPDIIRGNASEIMALANINNKTKGVDSTQNSTAAIDSAEYLSKKYHCTVSVSGEIDIIVKESRIIRVGNGHCLMPLVTGLGCSATAITAAFAAVNKSYFVAAANAMFVMGIAGEIAAEKSQGPGSMQVNFIDALYSLNEEQITSRIKSM